MGGPEPGEPPLWRDEPLESWGAFVDRTSTLNGRWSFRGVLESWSLQTALERACDAWAVPPEKALTIEKRVRRDFKRAFRRLSSEEAPADDDALGWLALMQHYGAPTRLLDWTYSPFVAAFFALDALLHDPPRKEPEERAAVWALFLDPFDKPDRLFLDDGDLDEERVRKGKDDLAELKDFQGSRRGNWFRNLFLRPNEDRPFPARRLVFPVNPWKLNQRLVVQQGVFMCPGDVSASFDENLRTTREKLPGFRLLRLLLPRTCLDEACESLMRMNVGKQALFPGLDGFAAAFWMRLQFLRRDGLFDDTRD